MTASPMPPDRQAAVMGQQSVPSGTGVVMGGLSHLQQRFRQAVIADKVSLLTEARLCGQAGVEFVTLALSDPSTLVQWHACTLLQECASPRVRSFLDDYLYFQELAIANCFRLAGLLALGQWQAANQETTRLLLQAGAAEAEGFLQQDQMRQLPPLLVQRISYAWQTASQNRFGFLTQKLIWSQISGDRSVTSKYLWRQLGDRVGWRQNQVWLADTALHFSLDAPIGHLPSLPITHHNPQDCLPILFAHLPTPRPPST